MKPKSRLFRQIAGSAVFVMTLAALSMPTAHAATQTWDNGSANFTWDTSSLNWGAAAWTNDNDAVFGAVGVGAISVSPGVIVNDITFNTAGYTLSGNLSLASDGASTITNGVAATISGVVSGSSSLTKAGAGVLTLSGANDYTGGSTINGILSAAHNSALGTGAVTINGATGNQLQLGDGVNVANALTINGGGVTAQGVLYLPAGNATYGGTINITAAQNAGGHFASVNNASVLTIAGDNTITSAVPVTIRSGTVVYSGSQNYTGGTSFNTADSRAMLQFAKPGSMPATGTVSVLSGTSVAVNAGGAGEFTATGTGAGTLAGLLAGTGGQGAAVTLPVGSSIGIDTTNAVGNVTFGNAYTSTNNVGLLKLGTGTLELTSGGTYNGAGAGAFPLIARRGTLLLNGGTHTVNGEAVIGGTFATAAGAAGYDASLQLNAGTFDVNGWLSVGRGNGVGGVSSDLVANSGTTIEADNFSAGYNNNNGLNLPKGTITLNSATFNITGNGAFNLAENTGAHMTMTLNGSSTLTAAGTGIKRIGNLGTGILNINNTATVNFGNQATYLGYRTGNGTVNMTGGTFNANGDFRVGGSDENGTGRNANGVFNISAGTANLSSLTVARGNNNQNTCTGEVNLSGTGTINSVNDVILGFAGADNLGKMTISGGTFNIGTAATKWFRVGNWDTSKGQLDISGGSLNLLNNSALKMNGDGTVGANVINQTGGAVTFYSNAGTTVGGTGDLDLQRAGAAASNNTYNLNGGTLTVPAVISTATTGTRTFNLNGGTLAAAGPSANFINLGSGTGVARTNVRNGGAIIHTNGYDVTIPQVLEHSNIDGDNAIDGGLTKQGAGNLTLTAANTYTGPTTITAGTLTLSNAGAVNGSSGVTINGSGAKLVQASGGTITPPILLTQGSLDGNGNMNSLTVADSAANTIATGNGAAGYLAVDTLTFQGAATLNLVANGVYVERFIDSTTLVTSPSADVVINATNTAGVWTSGTLYPLVEFDNYSVGDASHFTLGTVPGLNPNQSAELVNTGTSIALSVTGESLVWTGKVSSDWTTTPIGGDQNWSYLGSGIEFSTNSPVVFDDTADLFTVNLAQNVSPSAIVFNNESGDYTISSTGGFGILTGNLVKNGAAKLTIATNNSFTGTTTINGGVIEVTGTGSIAASSGIINNASLVFSPTNSPNVYANPISGTGSITKQGTGTLTLSGANTFSGDFTLDEGLLNFNSSSALGVGSGSFIVNGGTLDNTSGADITSTSDKPQVWNENFTFTGSHSLAMGTGAVTLAGTGPSRTVNVAANTLGVGPLGGTGGLVKTGAGTLHINRGGAGTLNGVLDIQGGIVGTTEDFYAEGLTGPGIFQNSGLAQTKWTFWNINTDQTCGTLIRNNDGSTDYQLGIVKRGTGTWTLTNNANNATSNLSVDAGKLILNNTGTYGCRNNDGSTVTNNTSVVGYTAAADAVLEINGATVNYNNRSATGTEFWRGTLNIGTNGTGAGAVKLNSGSLTTNMQLGIGTGSGAYGAFSQTGGTTTVGGFLATAFGTAQTVFNLSGGTYTQSAGPVTNGVAGTGVMNISGSAVYNQNGTGDNGIWLGENGTGIMNVSGSATINIAAVNNGIQLGRNATGAGVLNLLGGTVNTKAIYRGAGTGRLNFNGGTLKANQANTAFLNDLTSAYVRSGGGTIDNNGFAITIGQALLAPTGNGVSAAGLSVSGSGYIDTPVVTIVGDGNGATAVANVDSNGNLTGITVTNPGTGYTTPPAFALTGGGVSNTGGIDGTATLVANTSGGLTFTGTGITTLTAVNTYTGNTTVNSGSTVVLADNAGLKFAPGANGVSNKVTGAGNAYFYGDFTIDLSGAAIANGNSWTLVDTGVKTFDLLAFTVNNGTTTFTEISSGVHQLVDGDNTWTFTEADGKLTLSVVAPAGYSSWITGFGLPSGDQDPTDDPDNDGFDNLMEYVLGGNPNSSSTGIAPAGSKSGTNFVVTFSRNDLAVTGGDVSILLEYGNNLTGWTSVAVPVSNGTVDGVTFAIADGSPNDTVTATIPTSSAVKFFARVKAVK